ncbi:Longin [Metarhizium album ARSEF 1941]|uniref:Longin n=1 Tax=Metarhizium album (strain ARSEF 1941) TaxID=1081103 RepID=A0A0B2WQ91_METAS|nr:Longin [Metarhizium album ARSEF 1941]KHN98211.1 Longin [Metarhizium album ARSEF 1941]
MLKVGTNAQSHYIDRQSQDLCAYSIQDFVFHIYAHKLGVCGVAISDAQYPSLAAHKLLGNVVNEFLAKFPSSSWKDLTASSPRAEVKNQLAQYQKELQQQLAQYQDPAQIDTIGQIQRELDDTKQVLHQTIEIRVILRCA